jgi:sugar lactone lactonase YvrE
MSITVKCPGCGDVVLLADELVGKTVPCPRCEAALAVPAAPPAPEAIAAGAPKGLPGKPPPGRHEGTDDRPRHRPEKSSSGGVLLLVLGVAGLLVLGSCCVAVPVLGWLFLPAHPQPAPAAAPPDAVAVARDDPPFEWKGPPDAKQWKNAPNQKFDDAPFFQNILPFVEDPLKDKAAPPAKPQPATPVNLDAKGAAEVRGNLDPADRDPLGKQPCCKRFVVEAEPDTAYLAEVPDWPEIEVRADPGNGEPMIESQGFPGNRNRIAFYAEKARPFTVFVLGQPAEAHRAFTLRVRRLDPNEPLPDHLRLQPPTVEVPKVEVALQIPNQLLTGGAFSPDNKTFWTSGNELLTRWDHATTEKRGSYKVQAAKKWLHSLAVDARGRLYAQPMPPHPAVVTMARPVIGPIEIYEGLDPKGDDNDLPTPKRIDLHGIVRRMIASPDGRWVYFLDIHNRKVGRIDTETGAVDKTVEDISTSTASFCLTPDGKKIYCCSTTNRIDVIDAATFKLERTINLNRGQPHEIAATDKGLVYLLGMPLEPGLGGGNLMVVDLSRAAGDKVSAVPVGAGNHSRYLQMAPDQKTVFLAGDRSVIACAVLARPALFRAVCRDNPVRDSFSPGWMQISPDGRTILHDLGTVLSVSR